MKGFKFRLESVLDVKTTELRHVQKEHASAQQAVLEARQELEALTRERDAYARSLNQLQEQEAGDWQLRWDYLHHLNLQLQGLQEQLLQLEQKREEVRQKLVKIRREQKVLENLKQRAREKFLEESRRNEQKAIDELAVLSVQR
ncbi:MAG: flagellar export protein FliJ [Calditrichaeota bacterium]|nr:MAG: flagellar export protein FliJ [Calditrichota bacterium]